MAAGRQVKEERWHEIVALYLLFFSIKTNFMAVRKNSSNTDFSEERGTGATRQDDLSTDRNLINDEDNLDTQEISNDIEEGDEDYDDEELDEDDFEIDEEEDVDDDEEDEKDII